MTLLLDAYFSLSLGLKSSSMPFVEIANFTNLDFHKFFALHGGLQPTLQITSFSSVKGS